MFDQQQYINKWRRENPEKRSAQEKRYKDKYPIKPMLQNARNSARARGLEFSITEEDVVIPEVCPVLGIPLRRGTGKRSANSPSLDRIDSAKGYVRGNIIVVSWRVNDLKKNASLDELKRIVKFYEMLSV